MYIFSISQKLNFKNEIYLQIDSSTNLLLNAPNRFFTDVMEGGSIYGRSLRGRRLNIDHDYHAPVPHQLQLG
jgi:hypothetical protein